MARFRRGGGAGAGVPGGIHQRARYAMLLHGCAAMDDRVVGVMIRNSRTSRCAAASAPVRVTGGRYLEA